MISDTLFRSQDFKTRSTYVKLLTDARDSGAEALVFSSLHVSGSRMCGLRDCSNFLSELDDLTGVAAILRFPLPNLEDDSDESDYESSNDEDGKNKEEEEKDKDTKQKYPESKV